MGMGDGFDPIDLGAKVKELERLEADCKNAEAVAGRTRLILLGLVVGFLAFFLWRFYQMGTEFISEKNINQMVELARKKFTEGEDKFLKNELDSLVKKMEQPVKDEVMKHVKKESPKLVKAFEEQKEILIDKLPKQMEVKIRKHFEEFLDHQEKVLAEELPDVKDPKDREKVKKNLTLAMDPLLKKYYIEGMNTEIKKLNDLWDDFPLAAMPKDKEPSLEDQLYEDLKLFVWEMVQEVLKAQEMK
ncbi:MAG: hypothetical protein EXR99_05050 [Gemmataceae bacterium]|nr:hypothetical protein [Gemmataceae bacterium]